ncbi:ADP-ribose pyrophosphatase YjhB, NUDIX family [Paenibacillus sp. yr247]|uniref:NUDIX domain-containing protein n=1 Tax=Paenibacillus sp. yr247 TaxID=1761880 RepID=UPI00088A0FF4|nr:NUDIX domain-containing protein [Paenibacillus sp. yr247]SDO23254.1 ADP-ribose pyrophosphatase YjhB, NUDIX family [Paenibacillus sp. yr247]
MWYYKKELKLKLTITQRVEMERILVGFVTFGFGILAIISNSESQILLLKRTYGNKGWSLPGGGVDAGETIHEALFRECREELGIEVKDAALTGFYYHSSINAQVGIFRCSLPKDAEIKLSYEHSEYKWADISELSEVGATPHVETTEWEFLRNVGVSLGVPPEAILQEDKATNTFENARFSLKVLHQHT